MTRRQRLATVREIMERAGADVLIAASTGFHMIDVANPIDHLTGFRSLGPSLFLATKDRTFFIATPAADVERLESASPADACCATDGLVRSLQDWLGLHAVHRVGLFGLGATPHRMAAQIRKLAGKNFVELDEEIFAASGVKTIDEIENARKATEIAESGYELMRELARPGLKECDLAVALNLHMRELGANDSFLLLNAGPRSDAVMPSSERRLEVGDLILVELSPSVDGQFVQICRTASIGIAPSVTQDKYGLLVAAMQAGIDVVRPGIRMSAVCEAIDDYLSAAGYAEFSRPPFIRRRGHGLGSGSVWPGDVAVDNHAVLEEGMLFMVHPNQFLPETGYMMCGEPVVVRADGAEVLTRRIAQFDVILI